MNTRIFVLTESAEHTDIVEDAIKFIIFLSDVDRLYDVALGMYNFQLVLMIAQYSQKVQCRLLAVSIVCLTVAGPKGVSAFPARTARAGSVRAAIPHRRSSWSEGERTAEPQGGWYVCEPRADPVLG